MTSTHKPDAPVPPPYKFNQLPEDHRRILNYLFDKYIDGSHCHIALGLTRHEAHESLVSLFDNGEIRIALDRVRANGQIDPESRVGLEIWNYTANTYTLI